MPCLPVGHAPARIALGFTDSVTAIIRSAAVKANEFDNVYFVAVEFKHVGFRDSDDGVWTTNDLHNGRILAVDLLAGRFSHWSTASRYDPRINAFEGIDAVKSCLVKK